MYIDQFQVGEGGKTEWCICCSSLFALAGGAVGRLSLLLWVVRIAMRTALACKPCTIPFGRKREALDREGGRHRQGTWWLVRTGWQNGIPYPQGRALAGAHIAHTLMFQQPISYRHTAYSIFIHLNVTLLALHYHEGEIAAPRSGGTFQKTVDFYLSVKHTFSTNYNSKLH